MAYLLDFPDIKSDSDYDTDAVSVTSTRPSGSEQEYNVEALLAEKTDSNGAIQYLIKWQNFPLYSSTWEPESGLDGTGLLEVWEAKKKRMGPKAWQERNQAQELRYNKARKKRKAKRQRKRKKVERATKKGDSNALRRRSITSATKDKSSKPEATRGSPSRRRLHPRKLPLSQSPSSSESDKSEADDSVVEDIQQKQGQLKGRISGHGNQLFLSDGEGADRSTTVTSSPKVVGANKTQQLSQTTGAKSSSKAPASRSNKEKPMVTDTTPSSLPKRKSSLSGSTRNSAGSLNPKTGPAPVAIKRSAAAPIRILNQPSAPTRKEWTSGDALFKTAHFMRKAELRSRDENVPDESELHFIHPPPGGIPTPTANKRNDVRGDGDVYGRRDTRTRRRESTRIAEPSPPPPDPLIKKIPLMCFDWRNGGCDFSAERCRYHHSEGFPPSPHDGIIPGKYRTPALTCFPWLRYAAGCQMSDEECYFAHWNTGTLLVPHKGNLSIDRSERPRHERPLTCFYWLRGERGCYKPGHACSFAHENTGWLISPIGEKHGPEKIDVSERPRFILGKIRHPTLTCSRWLRSETGCHALEGDCEFAHWNTGFIGDDNNGEIRIDNNERPRSLPGKDRTQLLTCYSWLRSKQGCPKSEEDCLYLHSNTGWLAIANGEAEKIDLQEQPASQTMDISESMEGKLQDPPLTCWQWLRTKEGCGLNDDECSFAHKNTGWLSRNDGSIVPIDPAEPRRCTLRLETSRTSTYDHSGSPQNQRRHSQQAEIILPKRPRDLTCFFWKNSSCKVGKNCKFAHYETGTQAFAPGSKWRNYADIDVHEGGQDDEAPQEELILHLNPEDTASNSQMSSALRDLIGTTCKLNFKELFTYDDELLDRTALVIFHPLDHHKECELITRWLLLHHVEVHNFWFDGAWDTFNDALSDNNTGIVLVHPDFTSFGDIPGFGKLLRRKVNVWSVGRQEAFGYDPHISTRLPEIKQDCINIFPHGGIIYITDDVFEQTPQEALRIIELFIDKIEQCRRVTGPTDPWKEVDDGCLLWRIATRPELMNSIFEACEAYGAEIDANDPVQTSRLKLYSVLSSTKYVEQDIEGASFVPQPDDYFPIMSERRDLMDPYYEAQARSQDEANAWMVGLYAETVIDFRRSYRQYFVVHTDPSKVDWQTKWQHIGEIMTPEKCIEYFEQPGKESLFNFYEWAFPEKQGVEDSMGATQARDAAQRRNVGDVLSP